MADVRVEISVVVCRPYIAPTRKSDSAPAGIAVISWRAVEAIR